MSLYAVVAAVTDRIIEHGRESRAIDLEQIAPARDGGVNRPVLSCGSLAHGFAAADIDTAEISGSALLAAAGP